MSKMGQKTNTERYRDIKNAIIGAFYNTTPPTGADGDYIPSQSDSRGNIKVVIASGANATTVGTAGADAVSNTQNNLETNARVSGFNGTTWDRLRTAVTTVSATLTGFLNTLPWGIYNATPTTRTEGQGGPLQTNSKGSLNTTATTLTSGEVQDINATRVEEQVNYTNISASALIYTGAGRFKGFVVNSCGAGATIKFWDNTSAATTVVLNTMTFTAAVAQGPFVVDLPGNWRTTVGLYCTIAVAAMDVTIAWRQTA